MTHGCSADYGAADGDAGTPGDARQEEDPDVASSLLDAADASTADTADTAPAACDLGAPFSAPAPVIGLGTVAQDTYDPWVADDELEVYFARSEPGMTPRIFVATRGRKTDPFGAAVALGVAVNGQTYTERPSLTRDKLTIAFRSGGGGIAIATRANATASFGAGTLIAGLPSNPGSPSITGTGSTLYFSAAYKVYRASLVGGAAASVAEVPGIQLPSTEDDSPAVTPDERTLFFQSNRTSPTAGGRDLWIATRASTAQPFGGVTHLPELSTPRADFVGWVSTDGCVVYGASSPASGPSYIWRAQRPVK